MSSSHRSMYGLLVFCLATVAWADPPPGYYDSVDTSTSSTLRSTLHAVIDDHTRFPYTSSATDTWNILEDAQEDPANPGNILDVYRNRSFNKQGGGNSFYNREHTWPTSYGFPNDNSSNYPFTDCHQLFLCDDGYNSARSNKPFRDCDPGCSEEPTDNNNGQGGGTGVYPGNSNWTSGSFTAGTWEVWAGKRGDIARAMFYMDIRYEGGNHGVTNAPEPDLILTNSESLIGSGNTGSNESVAYMGILSVLLQWHIEDPVDADEQFRNDVVFSYQGNRNPFVDHPEWVDCLFNNNCTPVSGPSAPTGLNAVSGDGSVDLDWNDNSEPDLAGYNVYRSTSNGGPYSLLQMIGTSSAYLDTTVSNGTTYYYVVTAENTGGEESGNSGQASATPSGGGSGGPVTPWINEFHYDNSGSDTGEFFEIAGEAGENLSGWSLVGYNGNGGSAYNTINLSGIIPDQGGCRGTLSFSFTGMQNGSPDGLALVDPSNNVVEFISYEGSFVANGGPANGMTSINIGVDEDPAPAAGNSLQLSGTGASRDDFTWQNPANHTPGQPNNGQTFDGCASFPDCNNNGTDDADDISGGTSQDCNSNGIPDECETDSDGDGTIDACDGCPNDANKTAPGACGCGTADTDSDGDGTLDCNDGCPNDANKTAPGDCGCGVADTDSDGDGTPDCNDGCPNDANKTAPGDCGCGVADTDSDGDGTADCVDGCPNDANKTAPGDCGCGVADTDSDGDGTPDCNDGCPNDANKTDPGTCGCGVADADTDGDGVLDCNDNCPTNANPGQEDCDGDGTGDACAGEPDCNNNGIPDSCDISSGTSLDIDGNGIPDECVGPTPQLEAGTVSVGAGGTTVSLVNSYVSPVVVCTMQYDANTEPTVVRVSNVTGSSFDMVLVHPSGGTPATENVSYLVMEEGTWMIDGVACEAQKYTATLTDHDGSWGGTAQTYGQSYLNPVVVGQVMTSNDPEWSVFWCQGGSRTDPPSAGAIVTGKTVCEDSNLVRAAEEVGFIVFESGAGTLGGVDFEALLGGDTVAGVGNAPPYAYNFGTSFVTAPTVGVMTMAGVDGVNGGWAQFHGSTIATTTQLFLSIDEDVINDTERSHTTEQVGYVMFERDVVYPAVPDCSNDGDCDDGNPCNGVETCDGSGMCQPGPITDCNSNGQDDACDISSGTSTDCNSNGIPDECEADADGDGTIDACDNCPNDANKTDPGTCGCGVSDADSDGDGTPDCNDGCPNDANKTDPGTCGCGVSDADSDGDGTPDCNDGCPTDPNKTDPGACGCGVADTDSDGDGTPDCNDGCPTDPNKTDPGACGCGVADTDSDGDGTPDCNDGCPTDPNKTDPGACGCGVADTDSDGDGVADCNDNCPTNANPGQEDCDGDGVGDACAGEPDCNNNGIPDSCDISSGSSDDLDGNGIPDECEGTQARMETGTAVVGATPLTISLANNYSSAVVVCTIHYEANTIPVVTRVTNVTSGSFDVYLQATDGSSTPVADTVSYMVMEEGTWTIDGVNCEARKYNSSRTDENNSWLGEQQTYGQAYTNPVVYGQVMSTNDADWSVFWSRGSSRQNPASASDIWTGLHVGEDPDNTRASETIGYIVFESGSGTIGGVAYRAALGGDIVRGVTNGPPYAYSYSSAFGSTPQVGIVTMAAMDGGNGGWGQLWGPSPLSAGGLNVVVDEDQANDTERNHTPEQLGYIVFESALVVN